MKRDRILFGILLFVLWASSANAQIPRMLSYQGVLTDSVGTPKPDASYTITFRLFSTSSGGSAIWTEQKVLVTRRGLFSTILGDQTPIPDSLNFDKPYWMSLQVSGGPELSPRIPLTAVGYSLYSFKSDTAKFAFAAAQQKYADSSRIAGTVPNNSVTSQKILDGSVQRTDVGTNFTAPYADTAAYARVAPQGGFVDSARIAGTAVRAYTLVPGATIAGNVYNGTIVQITNSDSSIGGGYAINATNYSHNTWRPAIYGENRGLSAGVYGRADGWYGVVGWNQSNASAGVWGRNIGSGFGVQGESDDGIGIRGLGRTGVQGETQGASSSPRYGLYGTARNTLNGDAYGGYFRADPEGSGKHYGVYGYAGNSTWASYGSAYGGYFETRPTADGYHYGVSGVATTPIAYYVCGVSGYGSNSYGGFAYGGSFATGDSGSGNHIALQGWAFSSSPLGHGTTGVVGIAENSSNGEVTAGDFSAWSKGGTGQYIAVNAFGGGISGLPTYGVYSEAQNSSSGNVFAGYFNAKDYGTGVKYGVYARAPLSGWSGYIDGDLGVSHNLYVYGTKSAAVQTQDGAFHAMYCQESPESWFEDFGEGRLTNGKTTISIDPLFAQTVNTATTYHVFLTPHDEPVVLAVSHRTAVSFDVQGPVGSNVSFSYRIVIKRKGSEQLRLPPVKGLTEEELEAEHDRQRTTSSRHQLQLEEARKVQQERQSASSMNR